MYGSLDVSVIVQLMNAGHSAFSKSEKNGHIYMNIVQWINEEENQFGHISSIQPSSAKNASDMEREMYKKTYIGNMRLAKPEPPTTDDIAGATAAINKLGGTAVVPIQPPPANAGAGNPLQNGNPIQQPIQQTSGAVLPSGGDLPF